MFPTILQIGPLVISSLGLLSALGFFFGSFLFWERGRKEYFEEEELMDAAILSTLAALVGGRIGWGLLNLGEFSQRLVFWFNVVGKPGFWQFSAFLSAFLVLFWQAKKKNWDFFKVADIACFGVMLFLLFNRIGLFLDGSYYGVPTNLPLGLKFPGLLEKRHPLQLYEFLLFSWVFYLLFILEKNYRTFAWYQTSKGKAKEGFILAVTGAVIGLASFLFGFFKQGIVYWQGLHASQWAGLLFFIAGGIIIFLRSGLEIELDFDKIKERWLGTGELSPEGSAEDEDERQQDKPKKRKQPKKHRFKTGMDVNK